MLTSAMLFKHHSAPERKPATVAKAFKGNPIRLSLAPTSHYFIPPLKIEKGKTQSPRHVPQWLFNFEQ